jgi:hypothetical protein
MFFELESISLELEIILLELESSDLLEKGIGADCRMVAAELTPGGASPAPTGQFLFGAVRYG